MRRGAAAFVLGALVACADGEPDAIPVRTAPPSRHAELAAALRDDARAFAFAEGDWLEDLGDAPFFGLAWLARKGDLDADERARRDAAVVRARRLVAGADVSGDNLEEPLMAALGLAEHVGRTGDAAAAADVDGFADRLDARVRAAGDYLDVGASSSLAAYGPTAVTGLVALLDAQLALLVGGARAGERIARARAIDARLYEAAFGNLVAPGTGQAARAYAFAPGEALLTDTPNAIMLLVRARLFRATRDERYRLACRALFGALQRLRLDGEPARYASPSAAPLVGIDSRNLSTLAGQGWLALALLFLFEITGEGRFVDEADRLLDGVASLRGPWCRSQLIVPACSAGTCGDERCASGLLHHTADGRLAAAPDARVFCSGCNLEILYVLGYRRALAGEAE